MSDVPMKFRWDFDYNQINLMSFESTDEDHTGFFLMKCVDECTRHRLNRTHFLISAESDDLIGFITLSLRHCILPKKALRDENNNNSAPDFWSAVRIDQIAVTKRKQRMGFGTYMIETMISYIEEFVSPAIGCRLVLTEGYEGDGNMSFLSSLGFKEVPEEWMKESKRKRPSRDKTKKLVLMFLDLDAKMN